MLPLHHLSVRKRIHRNLEQYPHPKRYIRVFDVLVYGASIFVPIMTLPQVYDVYIKQNTQGISVISWSAYAISNAVWIAYGVIHKERPIIFVNIAMFILNTLVALGALLM